MTILNIVALDINKPAKEVLIDKLNAANSTNLQPNDFVLGVPQADVNVVYGYDTRVVLSPTTSSIWYQSITLFYKRVKLPEVFAVNLKVTTTGTETTLEEVLPLINAAYGINLTEADVEPASIVFTDPENLHSVASLSVVSKTTSPLFQGSATIALNTNNTQGPVVYEDNQTYFVHINDGTNDLVKVYNSLGVEITTFRFLEGATVHASQIKQMIHWPNNDVMVIGNFDYSLTDSLNVTTRVQRKLVRMNSRGQINGSSSATHFGVDIDLVYYPDPQHGFVYVLDHTATLGGNVHGLHRYLEDGSYDNTFATTVVNAAPSAINQLTLDTDGNIYIAYVDNGVASVKKLLPTGDDSLTTPPVATISLALEPTFVVDMRTTADALYVRLKEPTNQTKQNVMSVNGTALWNPADVNASGDWVEIVKLDLELVEDDQFRTYHNDRSANVLGIPGQLTSFTPFNSLTPSTDFVSYIGVTVSPVTGFSRPSAVALDAVTGRHEGITGHYYDDIYWIFVQGTRMNTTKEMMVWGQYKEVTQAGISTTVQSAVALYSRSGDMPQLLIQSAPLQVIKNVIAVSEDTNNVAP